MSDARDVRIALTFDYDAFSVWIGTFGATSPSMVSRGEFGPIALRRILKLLADHKISSTFFVPGHTAHAFPETVVAIRDAGHEIGHHGWVHENPLSMDAAKERQVMEKGFEVLDKIAGVKPVGYRSPAWDNSPETIPLLLEFGFEYESSLMGNDYEPYWCRLGDSFNATDEYTFGKPVNLVEVPVAWHLDDFPHFEYVWSKAGVLPGYRTTGDLLEIWKGEFDYLYGKVGKGILNITMHPQVIGRGHRMLFLEEFIKYVEDKPGVSFTTIRDYVRDWRVGKSPSLPADAGPNRVA
ncbi:polysaccharide deacetylase family protein [Bauldia litoralis]|uniref:Chitooligosaccharide deacetylase n=1 Tax=Bauldia litoralis TaxID=665467 RepID=A0A1G6EMC8_9HYPH|nr:polysaccharide deacetylase [Bauldia litoralis]SDB58456.1 Peptidoglycan/xylan/chitin deacetylase, PgdA/CDA1 family [Bauldia litoralis]